MNVLSSRDKKKPNKYIEIEYYRLPQVTVSQTFWLVLPKLYKSKKKKKFPEGNKQEWKQIAYGL